MMRLMRFTFDPPEMDSACKERPHLLTAHFHEPQLERSARTPMVIGPTSNFFGPWSIDGKSFWGAVTQAVTPRSE